MVRTRTAPSCRKHWLFTFCCKKLNKTKLDFTDEVFYMFIHEIRNLDTSIWKEINWESIWKTCDNGTHTPSPYALASIIRDHARDKLHIKIDYGSNVKDIIDKILNRS
ncbi:hypothetical protein RF11_16096 [Thelohanellus kitauei]|uniref:Uncharacterized protein n=1 Tax=Thelohanellus kitauei TaxID=669202 RepID=A0A0C2MVN6_THEKT|nr:hypothetical protein RF11_16096 [Thelohanellus kitauei]